MNKKNAITSKFAKALAFTFAEVLIVIGVLGIVAEIVIPGVIASTFDSVSLAMVKEDFSIIQQSIKMAELNEGRICDWYRGTADKQNANIIVNQIFAKYLKVAKNCGEAQGCFSPNAYKPLSIGNINLNALPMYTNINGYPAWHTKMILSNGSSLAIWIYSFGGSDPNSYIQNLIFFVDVNGSKEPNRWGYDTFIFQVHSFPDDSNKSQLLEAVWNQDTNNYNDITGCYSNAAISNWAGTGGGCAGWAIYHSTVKYKNGELLP